MKETDYYGEPMEYFQISLTNRKGFEKKLRNGKNRPERDQLDGM
jgi:hypothetical protein